MATNIPTAIQTRLINNLEKSAIHLRDYLKTLKSKDNRHYMEIALLAEEQEELAMRLFLY